MNKNDSVAPNTETHKSDSMNDQVLVTKSGGLTKFEQTVITMLAASRIANPSADPRSLAETARADAQALFDVLNGVVPQQLNPITQPSEDVPKFDTGTNGQDKAPPTETQTDAAPVTENQGASGADSNVTEKES